jgi:response regulator of citrate/malate metabolism
MKGEVEKYSYLYPINVRNLVKFAREYHEYREIYQKENQLKQLAIDRLIKMRVINSNGLVDYRQANKKIFDYEFFKKITI